jgi:hypothetical protein
MLRGLQDGGDQVESQLGEIGEIVACQLFAAEVSVHQPDATKALGASASATQIGDLEAGGVADDDGFDGPSSIEEQTYLASGLDGDGEDGGGELLSDDLCGRDFSSIESLERGELAGLEAG